MGVGDGDGGGERLELDWTGLHWELEDVSFRNELGWADMKWATDFSISVELRRKKETLWHGHSFKNVCCFNFYKLEFLNTVKFVKKI